jgi:hypothetical protein
MFSLNTILLRVMMATAHMLVLAPEVRLLLHVIHWILSW